MLQDATNFEPKRVSLLVMLLRTVFDGPTRNAQPGDRTKRPVVWTTAIEQGYFWHCTDDKKFVNGYLRYDFVPFCTYHISPLLHVSLTRASPRIPPNLLYSSSFTRVCHPCLTAHFHSCDGREKVD